MPDPAARDPHTPIFDRDGILWFTLQQSNMVGRLDPASGDVKLVTMRTPGAKPYGIKIDDQGTPWVACNGSNCLVKVDPATMALTRSSCRTRRPRCAVSTSPTTAGSGTSTRRRAGSAGSTRQAARSRSGRRPPGRDRNPTPSRWWTALSVQRIRHAAGRAGPLRPSERDLQSWPIPSGGVYAGIVRHMRPTRDGNLLIHQSSTNRIILVTLKRAAATIGVRADPFKDRPRVAYRSNRAESATA